MLRKKKNIKFLYENYIKLIFLKSKNLQSFFIFRFFIDKILSFSGRE